MNWDLFFQGMADDYLNQWCFKLIQAMRQGAHIVIVTGRSEDYRKVTEEWLKKHNVHCDRLLMRAKDDRRPDTEVKLEIYETKIKPTFDVWFAVDDRKSVVDMWRANGVVCLQCAPGEF
jgi:hypothetical protein